jgi:hypothetical protein
LIFVPDIALQERRLAAEFANFTRIALADFLSSSGEDTFAPSRAKA